MVSAKVAFLLIVLKPNEGALRFFLTICAASVGEYFYFLSFLILGSKIQNLAPPKIWRPKPRLDRLVGKLGPADTSIFATRALRTLQEAA